MGAAPSCCSDTGDVPPIEVVEGEPSALNLGDAGNAGNAGKAGCQLQWTAEPPIDEHGPEHEPSRHLRLDSELLRGIPLNSSLQGFGRLWRKSPIDLPEAARGALWEKSVGVEKLDIFLSHTWHTPGSQKIRALMVQSGCHCFVLGWLLGGAVAVLLELFAFPRHRNLSARLGGFVGSLLGFLASPYLPQPCGREMCFLDVVCIHQADPELMQRGIYGLGGFLKASSEMRILWSPPYLSRLWCIFELAAFRKANPSGRIALKPLYLEVGLLYAILANYVVPLVHEMHVWLSGTTESWRQWMALLILPFVLLVHKLRRLFHQKRQLIENMKSFELANVSCRVASDRDFIYAGIREWYGSEEAFEQYVKGPLYDELAFPFRTSEFPAVYWLMLMTPVLSAEVDYWLAGLESFDLHISFLAYVVAASLLSMNLLSLGLLLCDVFARPAAGIWDYGKTLLIWLLLGLGLYGLNLQTDLILRESREVALGVCAAQAVACFLLIYVVPKWTN